MSSDLIVLTITISGLLPLNGNEMRAIYARPFILFTKICVRIILIHWRGRYSSLKSFDITPMETQHIVFNEYMDFICNKYYL